jgi:hypothetical protein
MTPAYLAGFLDGEGSIGFARCRTSIFPRVFITNTNIEILELFKEQFGGDIKPLSKRKEGWKQGYCWRLSWTPAVMFLDLLSPYLVIKIDQAITVFAWNAIRLGRGRVSPEARSEYEDSCDLLLNRIRWLNKKGPTTEPDPIEAYLPSKAGRKKPAKKK